MNIWILAQVIVNLIFLVGIVAIWARMKRPPKDDPRLSRGLQLLQSKISVLEDLSDRTDRQVEQMTKLLDNKARQVQKRFLEAEKYIQKIKSSMDRSMEVASIFQDKIPHDEIIERQNTIKHVQAARLAHQGHSVDEILVEIDLPREQVEFIAKVNKDQLMFDESQLPAWVETPGQQSAAAPQSEQPSSVESMAHDQDFGLLNVETTNTFDAASPQYESLKKLGEEFRQACQSFEESEEAAESQQSWESVEKVKETLATSPTFQKAKGMTNALLKGVSETLNQRDSMEASSDWDEDNHEDDTIKIEQDEAAIGNESPTEPPANQEASSQSEQIAVVSSEPKKFGPNKQIVRDIEVKKVVFPQVDVTDNLS